MFRLNSGNLSQLESAHALLFFLLIAETEETTRGMLAERTRVPERQILFWVRFIFQSSSSLLPLGRFPPSRRKFRTARTYRKKRFVRQSSKGLLSTSTTFWPLKPLLQDFQHRSHSISDVCCSWDRMWLIFRISSSLFSTFKWVILKRVRTNLFAHVEWSCW